MRTVAFVVGGALSAGLLSCSTDSGSKPATPAAAPATATENPLTRRGGPLRQQWAMDRLWEDGKAEVATYEAERVVYGEPRRFDFTLITVKEEFNQQYNVKTDDTRRKDVFPVMKVNQFCTIPTEQYPYHFLTSLFFRRDQPAQLYKLTTSSQEWCGNTFKAILDDGMQYVQTYNSYWDGQGGGQRQLRRVVLFEDALPYTLRSLRFEALPTFKADVYELQQTNQAPPPVLYHAQIRTEDALTADTPEPAWCVTVALTNQKQNVYWFGKRYPNVLLRQSTWDGRTLRLKQVRRYVYWPVAAAGSAAPDTAAATPAAAER
ncbi:hypothetical protein [Hymenobacter glacieicola]|uniref:Septum formation inhibitor Maf n=1 Tax=Hymenobacter glacieicola TaxID=1562124 RepID=A0ABQ1WRH0_9BACT|nr:hypothetical protein [Hymenobacter glacieicola]GGG42853.1 hypothetical protein GCM10011378_19040 [Hymenobacter glacieicola]